MANSTKKMGVVACTAVVAGNMMGSGIALLPANLAALGSITIIGWCVALVGALALAYVFSRLGMDDPQDGGPIAYAGEVAPILGYQTGLLYYCANLIGNIAIALTGVDYLSVFFPVLLDPLYAGITSICLIWLFAGINILGADWIGKLVSVGVMLLLIPVAITGTIGWTFFDMSQFQANWLVAGQTQNGAILSGIILCIWSFIGVESASVGSSVVDNPKRTIPIATMLGTSIAGIMYILSCTAISGMFPAATMASSGAPFSLAVGHIAKGLPFAEYVPQIVSAVTAFACLAALGSWMMLVAQAGCRASADGTLPSFIGKKNKHGTPISGIIFSAIAMTALLVVLMILAKGGNTQSMFGSIVNIAVLLTLPAYFYSALCLIRSYGFKNKKAILQLSSAVIACVFCLVAFSGATKIALFGAMSIMLCTFIFYVGKDRKEFEAKNKK